MRTLRILGALLLGIALMLAPMSGAHADPGGPGLPTDVVITKVEMSTLEGWPKTSDDGTPITGDNGTTTYDGSQITDMDGFFGTSAEVLPGVTFSAYSVSAAQYATLMGAPTSYDTVTEMTIGTPVGTAVTDGNGQATFAGLANGYYWFIEDLTVAGSPMVNAAAAVPFGLELPVLQADGSYFGTGADALYVYPKNTTGDEPTVDKDVTTVGNDSDSANVGDNVTWIIDPTLPADIATYQVLTFTDEIDSRLDYQNTVVVTNSDTPMVAGTDYTITQPTVGQAGGTLVIAFTPTGIAKLTAGNTLKITFQTSINETAVVGSPIPNNVTLDYTNGSGVEGTPATVPPTDEPEVWTGGKRFVKVVEGATGDTLEGAVFRVESLDSTTATPVLWTADLLAMNADAIDDGKFAVDNNGTYVVTSATSTPVADTPIYVISDANGAFEIAGLQGYEPASAGPATEDDKINTISHPGTYQLVEVQAPDGYALLTSPVPFTVTKTSYWADPTAAPPVAAEAQPIANMGITIPPTGGIGTVVFVLAGLALMGGAAYGMRRRSTVNA